VIVSAACARLKRVTSSQRNAQVVTTVNEADKLPSGKDYSLRLLLVTVIAAGALAGASAAPAVDRFTETETIPYSDTLVSCTGEIVQVTGSIETRRTLLYDPNGGYHFKLLMRGTFTGVSDSGTRYVGSFVNEGTAYINLLNDEEPTALTFPYSFRLISNDGSPDLLVRELLHLTYNANGLGTASWWTVVSTC
jgi:hypothetical protein